MLYKLAGTTQEKSLMSSFTKKETKNLRKRMTFIAGVKSGTISIDRALSIFQECRQYDLEPWITSGVKDQHPIDVASLTEEYLAGRQDYTFEERVHLLIKFDCSLNQILIANQAELQTLPNKLLGRVIHKYIERSSQRIGIDDLRVTLKNTGVLSQKKIDKYVAVLRSKLTEEAGKKFHRANQTIKRESRMVRTASVP